MVVKSIVRSLRRTKYSFVSQKCHMDKFGITGKRTTSTFKIILSSPWQQLQFCENRSPSNGAVGFYHFLKLFAIANISKTSFGRGKLFASTHMFSWVIFRMVYDSNRLETELPVKIEFFSTNSKKIISTGIFTNFFSIHFEKRLSCFYTSMEA